MTLAPGDRIGGYEVLAPLKSGGMATLFLARRAGAAGFSKHVAIKVVHPHLAEDRSFVELFLDEARLCSRIEHPNVVHVEELGESAGTFFLVMEYVHGASLWQLMTALRKRRRVIPVEVAVAIALQVAEGLHAAHETRGDDGELLGVVHRDVSPQNVLVAYRGFVKLIDFGVAKAAGRSETAAGLLKGKIGYMAPEQAFGRKLDRRIDVYALGIVLWELLVGRRLFRAEGDIALLEAVRHPEVPRPSSMRADVPSALDDAVYALLAPEPEGRVATAADARELLASACPDALRVTSGVIAALVQDVLQDQMEAERRSLPPSFSSVVREPVGEPATVLHASAVGEAPEQPAPTPNAVQVFAPPPAAPARADRSSAVRVLMLRVAGAIAVASIAVAGARSLTRSERRPAGEDESAFVVPPLADAVPPPDAGIDAGIDAVRAMPVEIITPDRGTGGGPLITSPRVRRDGGRPPSRIDTGRPRAGPAILRELYEDEP